MTLSIYSGARRLARKVVFPSIERLWTACFALAGATRQPGVRQLTPSKDDCVLVLAPHPDDETIGCGGTIALHTLTGSRVVVCIVTDGAKSKGAGLTPNQTRLQRHAEARNAMNWLGNVELLQSGMPERQWQESDLIAQLSRIFDHVRPTIVYTTSFIDYHPEHIRIAHTLANAIEMGLFPGLRDVRLYEVQVPLTPILANVVADIRQTKEVKARALSEYATQLPSLLWLARYARYQRRLYRSKFPIEVFCELTPEQFIACSHEARKCPATYRGIRPRPISDPGAWLVGTKARRRLRQIISQTAN